MALCNDLSGLGNYTLIADVGHLPVGAARYTGVMVMQTDTKQLKLWDGTGWVIMSEPIQTYTPVTTGITIGSTSGTAPILTGRYHRSDGWCDVEIRVMLGAGGAVTGQVTVRLPIAADTSLSQWNFVSGLLYDNSANTRYIAATETGGSDMIIQSHFISNSQAVGGSIGVGTPFTWAVNDEIRLTGRYRMVTRYS